MGKHIRDLVIRLFLEFINWLYDLWKKWKGGSHDDKGNAKAQWQGAGA